MKKGSFTVLAFVALFVGGCSFKDSVIEFSEPKSIYIGEKAYAKAFFERVSDDRANKKRVGVVRDRDGGIIGFLNTDQDMSKWIGVALEKEMRAAGFALVSNENDADYSYSFSLTKLNVQYAKEELTGKNLRLEMDIVAKIKNKNGVITKNYKYDEQKWVKPLFDSNAIKKEIEPFMSESIAAIVKDLTVLSKTK